MHDLDGLQATRQILSNPETSSIPVIMVTASAFGDSRQASFEAGCVDFIVKPIRAEQLFQKLQTHTRVHFVSFEEDTVEEKEIPIPDDGSLSVIGKRLEEAASIGNISELDAIVSELGKGNSMEVSVGSQIARLRARFDFDSVTRLAQAMQQNKEASRADG
jgi:CheY-like chemotaxis protein